MRKSAGWIFGLIVGACCLPLSSIGQPAPAKNADVEQHIQHVTSGLIGGVVIKGDEHSTHALAERMKELNVPGVSIAVLHNGKIEWARGLGCAALAALPSMQRPCFKRDPSANRWQRWHACVSSRKESLRSIPT